MYYYSVKTLSLIAILVFLILVVSAAVISTTLYHGTSAADNVSKLKTIVADEYPQMNNLNITDFEKVNAIRQFVAEHNDWGNHEFQLDERWGYYTMTAPELYDLFLTDTGGTLCSGTAHELQQFYEMYGYSSYMVYSGKPSVFTHASTIVNISYNGKYVWSVQDAHVDETYTTVDGAPIDYFEMLRMLRNNDTSEIITVVGNSERDYFINSTEPISYHCIADVNMSYAPVKINNAVKYKASVKMENIFNETCCPSFAKLIHDNGHPPSPLYLYLYPFNILERGYVQNKELLEKAKESAGT